jgi:hypothetical protein
LLRHELGEIGRHNVAGMVERVGVLGRFLFYGRKCDLFS